jgi:hypothetical protein
LGDRRFVVELIKPSHYDDDGYVIQWWKSWIPSNSLACLYGIAPDLAAAVNWPRASPIVVTLRVTSEPPRTVEHLVAALADYATVRPVAQLNYYRGGVVGRGVTAPVIAPSTPPDSAPIAAPVPPPPAAACERDQWFESILLQQTVRLSRDFAFLYRKAGICRGVRGPGQAVRRQRRVGLVNITPTAGNVSVGRYSSTAGPNGQFATVVAVVR